METLSQFLRQSIIPEQTNKKWMYVINTSNSCFRFDMVNIDSVALSGHGHTQLEEMMVSIDVRLYIGNCFQVIEIYKRGLSQALELLFSIPNKAIVCRECGKARLNKETPCESCLFIEVFAKKEGHCEICTICQEETFRTVLPCGHSFHMTCLMNLSPSKAKCPNCRTPFPASVMKDCFGEYDSDSDDEDDYH